MKAPPRSFPRCAARLLIAPALGLLSTFAAVPSPAIQQRIDALLKHRLDPTPLPVELPNPFQVVKGSIREYTADDSTAGLPATMTGVVTAPAADGSTPPKTPATASNAEVLTSAAARLKVGGFIVLNDQIQVVINGAPRREGDMIAVDWNSGLIYLKIVRLLSNEIVLRYGDTDAILRF